jgi:hypothetical protein
MEATVRHLRWEDYSLKEQFALAANTSVMVSAPGTSASRACDAESTQTHVTRRTVRCWRAQMMMAMFLPAGATLVVICQFRPESGTNCGNELPILWANFPHLHVVRARA